MTKKIRKLLILVLAFIFIGGAMAIMLYHGIIQCNHPSKKKYPVRGVDVSSYQGEIDWELLSRQDIQFAYIKATEGSSFVDPRLADNLDAALDTDLRIGAYHFFSFDSAGETQAENFIIQVPKEEHMLPPVVDVEFYGNKAKNPPAQSEVVKELSIFITALEEHYGKTPVIYTTNKVYKMYIKDNFTAYPVWIRSVYCHPSLMGRTGWTFWQYSNRTILDGYQGKEKFIDMNVFHGTQEEFNKL